MQLSTGKLYYWYTQVYSTENFLSMPIHLFKCSINFLFELCSNSANLPGGIIVCESKPEDRNLSPSIRLSNYFNNWWYLDKFLSISAALKFNPRLKISLTTSPSFQPPPPKRLSYEDISFERLNIELCIIYLCQKVIISRQLVPTLQLTAKDFIQVCPHLTLRYSFLCLIMRYCAWAFMKPSLIFL